MAIAPSAAFVTPLKGNNGLVTSTTTMSMSGSSSETSPSMPKIAATAALAGVCLLSNVMAANAAIVVDDAQMDFGPTSTVIAGRGGGRGGGRAYGGRSSMRSRPAGQSYTRTINRTYISSPPVVVSPFGMGMGYGYNPLGGVGLGYGLGAASNIGNEIRDSRQEGEIQQERMELEQAKAKAAQLEARLEQLEKQNTDK